MVERFEAVHSVGGGGLDVASDRREGFGAVVRPEGPRYFVMDLDHAERPFGDVVIGFDVGVVDESQDLVDVVFEDRLRWRGIHR